jgi:dienelactone hydrolase
MKSVFLTALLSSAAVAQLPDGFHDFRGGSSRPTPTGAGEAPPGKGMGSAKDSALKGILALTPTSFKGPYKAKILEGQPLAQSTIYAPVDPPPMGQKWPGVIYHNNGCLSIGKVDQKIVMEIVSFGYYVVADGNINSNFTSGPGGTPNFATSDNGIKEIEWVVDQAEKGNLPNVDATKFGVAGTSCGGLQSYTTLQHKRVLAAAIISSGLFGGGPGRAKINEIRKPIAYFEGGPPRRW